MSPLIQKRKSVLIVDDDAGARNAFRTCVLEQFPNSSILESTDGKDAYLKISRQKFDLVVTEIKLPKLDGNQLLKSLKDFKSDLAPGRILVASSLIPAGTRPDPNKPISFVCKPAIGDPLIAYLKAALGQPGAETSSVDLALVTLAITCVSDSFAAVTGIELRKGRTSLVTSLPLMGEIGAHLELTRPRSKVGIVLSMPTHCYQTLLQQSPSPATPESRDRFLEVAEKAFKMIAFRAGPGGKPVETSPTQVLRSPDGKLGDWGDRIRISTAFQSSLGLSTIVLELHF